MTHGTATFSRVKSLDLYAYDVTVEMTVAQQSVIWQSVVPLTDNLLGVIQLSIASLTVIVLIVILLNLC
jgi:hypothetical protein